MFHMLIEMYFTGSVTDHFLYGYQLTCLACDMCFKFFFLFIGNVFLQYAHISKRDVLLQQTKPSLI